MKKRVIVLSVMLLLALLLCACSPNQGEEQPTVKTDASTTGAIPGSGAPAGEVTQTPTAPAESSTEKPETGTYDDDDANWTPNF